MIPQGMRIKPLKIVALTRQKRLLMKVRETLNRTQTKPRRTQQKKKQKMTRIQLMSPPMSPLMSPLMIM